MLFVLSRRAASVYGERVLLMALAVAAAAGHVTSSTSRSVYHLPCIWLEITCGELAPVAVFSGLVACVAVYRVIVGASQGCG